MDGDLADLVVPLVYRAQSKTLLYEYKTALVGGTGGERGFSMAISPAVHRRYMRNCQGHALRS